MEEPMIEKEKVVTMLTGIYNQLIELDSVLKESFTDLRDEMLMEEQNKVIVTAEKISALDTKLAAYPVVVKETPGSTPSKVSTTLKLEMGF